VSQVDNVRGWLEANGFARFADTFEENEIDGEALLELTEKHLKDLGIALGPRLKLLKAIQSLRKEADEKSPVPGQMAKPDSLAPRVPEAERRQLTVMFVDLVGSTALSTRLDPEEMREVIRAFQDAVAGEIARFEGYVARFMGDGVLAYFGWPRAHEDDAERAVRAGLALVKAIAQLEPGIEARVGVATGSVVAGDLIGRESADTDTVIGETPNLAARLQMLAEPGTVVISQATCRLVIGLFELDDLGPQGLKGFAEPLPVWRVAGETWAEGRFEARHTAGLTPLIGREEEISLLLRRWQQAKGGEGKVVLLSGEAGIGKSRLVRELRARLGGEPHIQLFYQCSPYHTSSPLHPLIEQIERAAGFERDDPVEAKLDKLEALLARGRVRLDQAVPLTAALLAVPAGERYPALNLTPEQQKRRTLEVLLEQLDSFARKQSVLVVYEDVHWIDPSTRELLDLVVERAQRLPVLALITFRPEFSPPWLGCPHVATLTLNRLGPPQGEELVHELTGAKTLPKEVRKQILAKTDGVPLFVEELTKTVLESGLLADAGDHYELSGPLPPLAIPATLHDSLMARLDRLASVKEVAQVGAVIGREFSYELLAAVAPISGAQLTEALDQLVGSELVSRRGKPPYATYSFKHALIQDAAYQSLLKSKRQQLHGRIGPVLEERFPETIEHQPELVAYHFTEARLAKQAISYWDRAGKRAIARDAQTEATAHFTRALELLDKPVTLTIRMAAGRNDLTASSEAGTITFERGVMPWAVRRSVEEALRRLREPQARLNKRSQ
jgi:class 3 adenylate cyclase